jgi:hypothetical protein
MKVNDNFNNGIWLLPLPKNTSGLIFVFGVKNTELNHEHIKVSSIA